MGAGVKQVEQFKWFLPGRTPLAKPYLSSWHMTADEAKARGALRPDLSTRTVIDVAETPEEQREIMARTDTSKWGGTRVKSITKNTGEDR